jgi:hypothetical protein
MQLLLFLLMLKTLWIKKIKPTIFHFLTFVKRVLVNERNTKTNKSANWISEWDSLIFVQSLMLPWFINKFNVKLKNNL